MGCGCRGQQLARELTTAGHAVRGTSRDPERLPAIEATGAEGVQADPDRLGTVLVQLAGVTVVCWLMGSAAAAAEQMQALHGDRLRSLLAKLVDSGARGLVYDATGSVDPALRRDGAELARQAGEANRMPVAVIEADGSDHEDWLRAARAAVDDVLSAEPGFP